MLDSKACQLPCQTSQGQAHLSLLACCRTSAADVCAVPATVAAAACLLPSCRPGSCSAAATPAATLCSLGRDAALLSCSISSWSGERCISQCEMHEDVRDELVVGKWIAHVWSSLGLQLLDMQTLRMLWRTYQLLKRPPCEAAVEQACPAGACTPTPYERPHWIWLSSSTPISNQTRACTQHVTGMPAYCGAHLWGSDKHCTPGMRIAQPGR